MNSRPKLTKNENVLFDFATQPGQSHRGMTFGRGRTYDAKILQGLISKGYAFVDNCNEFYVMPAPDENGYQVLITEYHDEHILHNGHNIMPVVKSFCQREREQENPLLLMEAIQNGWETAAECGYPENETIAYYHAEGTYEEFIDLGRVEAHK